MRSLIARFLDWLCSKTHWTHRIAVPESWFEDARYAGWRGRVCNLLYGCPLVDLAWKIEPWVDYRGTPWAPCRPDPDNPYSDGMDDWGDPVDWESRENRNKVAGLWPFKFTEDCQRAVIARIQELIDAKWGAPETTQQMPS